MRRIFIAVILLACIFLFICFSIRPVPVPNSINADTLGKIQYGMTRENVVALLGVPAGDYRTKRIVYICPEISPHPSAEIWTSNDVQIRIYFDNDDRVERSSEDWRVEESAWWRIRGWFDFTHQD